jgi:hypothetical protein
MGTFKGILKDNIGVNRKAKCNLDDESTPDGIWALANDKLERGHLLCVSYNRAVDDLPKLIIDSFINKFNRIPDAKDFEGIIDKVKASMQIAIDQGKLPE